jgi:hypothetical protein
MRLTGPGGFVPVCPLQADSRRISPARRRLYYGEVKRKTLYAECLIIFKQGYNVVNGTMLR